MEEKHEKEVERQKLEKEKRETEKKAKQVPAATSQTEANESERKESKEEFFEEIKETSNHSSIGGKKVVQTQLKFGQPRLNNNSNSVHTFYSCEVEIEVPENSQGLDRILMEREGTL